METFLQTSTRIATAIFLVALIAACQSNEKYTRQSGMSIPELLDRNERVRMGKEWDYVQNQYVSLRSDLQSDPANHEAHLSLAHLFVQEARITGEHGHYYPAALKMTGNIISDSSVTSDLRFRSLAMHASVMLSQHDFKAALETAKEALAINSQNAHIHGVMVDALVEMGSYKEAVAHADKMIALKPDLRSYARVSYLREIHGDVDGAISAMRLAVQAGFPGYEQSAWAMLTLGELYERYGQTERAKKCYAEILNDRPDYPFALAALAALDMIEGDLDKAESTLLEAVDIIPEVGFYIQLADLHRKRGDIEATYALYTEILDMLKDDVDHGHNMNLEYATFYLDQKNDPVQAEVYAMNEYRKRPQNIDVNRLMSRIYLAQNRTEEATEYFLRASSTGSQHPELRRLQAELGVRDLTFHHHTK